jgi:hypothetical protein
MVQWCRMINGARHTRTNLNKNNASSVINLQPLRICARRLSWRIMVSSVPAEIRALPLERGQIISQKRRSGPNHRRRPRQRAQRVVLVPLDTPIGIEAVRAREQALAEKAGRQGRDGRVDIHVVGLVGRRSGEGIRWASGARRE